MVCDWSDLPVEQCAHCQGHDDKAMTGIIERVIRARFNGICPSCENTIRVGEEIGFVDGSWLCRGCC